MTWGWNEEYEIPKLTLWQKWRCRWRTLQWKAFLPWVKIPGPFDKPRRIVFPLFKNPGPQINLTKALREAAPFDEAFDDVDWGAVHRGEIDPPKWVAPERVKLAEGAEPISETLLKDRR